MNEKIKTRWIKALRSGKYKQGRSYLHADDKFCCLGVLCELAVESGVILPARKEQEDWCYTYGVSSTAAMPPAEVKFWSDLTNADTLNTLANMNDGGYSFEDIADFIEANFTGE